MTLQQKIDMAISYNGNITKKEIAERLGTSPQSFGQRLKIGKFTQEELEKMAAIMGAEYISYFKFPDGNKIGQKDIVDKKVIM